MPTTDVTSDSTPAAGTCGGCDSPTSSQTKICVGSLGTTFTAKFNNGFYQLKSVKLTGESGDAVDLDSIVISYKLDYDAELLASDFAPLKNSVTNDVSRPSFLNYTVVLYSATPAVE